MTDTNRRFLISCLIISLVICICLSGVAIASALGLVLTRGDTPIIQIPDIPSQDSNPAAPEAPRGQSDFDIKAKMDDIQSQVINLRGLQPGGDFQRALMTPDELRQKVVNDFLKDYTPEEESDDVKTLAAFGLLPPGFELRKLLENLYSEQIGGFYDSETKEMFVIQGQGFHGPEMMTYAHEYTHALQDQNYDIQNGLKKNKDACEQETERCAAVQALLEGDASLSGYDWLQKYATKTEQKEIIDFYDKLKSPIYDSTPEYLKADFLFPYNQGLEFVQNLFDSGGWEAVNTAYLNPPVSTEQILHPERYPADQPLQVSIPNLQDTLGNTWRQIDQGEMGEWYTYLILSSGFQAERRLPEKEAQNAAEGWGGDAYEVYYNEAKKATSFALVTTWDTSAEADEFGKAFSDFGTAWFDTPGEEKGNSLIWQAEATAMFFSKNQAQTVWIVAPDLETVEKIFAQIEKP